MGDEGRGNARDGIIRHRFYEGQEGNQEGTLTGEEGVAEKAGGTRDGLHNKNSKIQRMCSDLIGLQGLLLGQTQTGKHVPK